jgi:thiamine-phosphate pyrophosphorylase
MILPRPRLMLITDRRQARRPLVEVVRESFEGGCRWVSVREKDLGTNDRRRLTRELVKLGDIYGATVTLHGDVATAEAARAAGVHVGQGTSPGAVRSILAGDVLVGASVHSWAEAEQAQADGADYVTVSPIFETASKPGYGPALGLEILSEFCEALRTPVVALGGVTPETAVSCIEAGASAVAVMGEVMRADDPRETMRAYVNRLG